MAQAYQANSTCRIVMLFRGSNDKKIRDAGVTTRAGSKWAADASVKQAESMLKLRDIIGNPCMERQGYGSTHF